jgi:hypothetical protein
MSGDVHVVVSNDNTGVELASLQDWMRSDPDLRGRVRLTHLAARDETAMGVPVELVVALGSASTAVVALSRAVTTWIVQRRSDVSVTVTSPNGRNVTVDAKRIKADHELIRKLLELDDQTPDDGIPDAVSGP